MILLDVDPSVVRPGWTALVITILLAAAATLLVISMRRHMKRIQVPYRDELGADDQIGADDEIGADMRESATGAWGPRPGPAAGRRSDHPAGDGSPASASPSSPSPASPSTPGGDRDAVGHSG